MAQPPLSAQTPPSIPNSSSSSSMSPFFFLCFLFFQYANQFMPNCCFAAPSSSPAPPISYAVNQNLNASGNSHQPPSHSVSITIKLFVMIQWVYGHVNLLQFNSTPLLL
jgi:hypothetical protein